MIDHTKPKSIVVDWDDGSKAVADLILKAIDSGYDVIIAISERPDGSRGVITVPIEWRQELERLKGG